MILLPFWKSEIYVEISPHFPYGRDYKPFSENRFYNDNLKNIAALCLDLQGEFYFMSSPLSGCAGILTTSNKNKNLYGLNESGSSFSLGFLMVLGYSEILEKSVLVSLLSERSKGLSAGISFCAFWSGEILRSKSKVIAIVSDDPLYDCTEYLKYLEYVLQDIKTGLKTSDLSYYAEKFGYDRFCYEWENENPYDSQISREISEFQYEGTKEIIGGSNCMNFPDFMGITVTVNNK